ncbi:MAG: hypothetical protein AAFY71_02240 [Bacteroidota bacterium]
MTYFSSSTLKGFALSLLILSVHVGLGQKIDYAIPAIAEGKISLEDYKTILDSSLAIIQTEYDVKKVKEGSISLKKGKELSTINLDNLLLKCTQEDKEDWQAIIRDHFQRPLRSSSERALVNYTYFDEVAPFLSIRVYEEIYFQQFPQKDNIIYRKDLEGTVSMLMLDLPSVFTTVDKSQTENWNKTDAELFARAEENLGKIPVVKTHYKIPFEGDSLSLYAIEEENYASSYALDLKHNSKEFIGEFGSVVAIPTRGTALIFKINRGDMVSYQNFITQYSKLVKDLYYDQPHPVSPYFFWYHEGRFTKIKVDSKDGLITVNPPEDLLDLASMED